MAAATTLGDQFAAVLAGAQQGEAWALTRLYEHLHPRLERFLLAQDRDGEDLAAETWIDVARGIRRFDGDEAAFRRWLYTIANRRLTDARRARGRRPVEFVDPTELVAPATGGTDADVVAEETARRIVALLSKDQAEVVLLRVVAGFSAEETAELVGKRPGAVRALQHRALRQLAKKLSDPHNAGLVSND